MKKSILNLKNVQVLTIEQQKSISGGSGCGCPSDIHGIVETDNHQLVKKA